MIQSTFSPAIHSILDEFAVILKKLAGDQRYAIAVSGSLGKGTWDSHSDVDFRLFTDRAIPWPNEDPQGWKAYFIATERWKERGIRVDDVWPRTVGDINAALDRWTQGDIPPLETVWTIWGYHLLTDINNLYIIEDPYGIIGAWKERLRVYPPALKQAILKKYMGSLQYWRADYHYANKVKRDDVIFTAGLTAKLVHAIMQILFALNETYFVGDGSNLIYAEKFKILPENFLARVQKIFYPSMTDPIAEQYTLLTTLIDEVTELVLPELS